jgi:RNA polymerase sigma factor (TIGR02999 family)
MSETRARITGLLRAWRDGDAGALDRLGTLLHAELRRLAAAHLRRERRGHTFTPTELVSEAFARLLGAEVDWTDRIHFIAAAAQHMRRILVDHARKRRAEKRGGGERAVTLDEALVGSQRPHALLALDDALNALAAHDERKARVIELHYFGGMTQPEIAALLEIHVNTVARDLRLAQAWLAREIDR